MIDILVYMEPLLSHVKMCVFFCSSVFVHHLASFSQVILAWFVVNLAFVRRRSKLLIFLIGLCKLQMLIRVRGFGFYTLAIALGEMLKLRMH